MVEKEIERQKNQIKLVVTTIIKTIVHLSIISAILMYAWNYAVIAALPMVMKITFWQAMALKIVVNSFTSISPETKKD